MLAIEADLGDCLVLTRSDGRVQRIEIFRTWAELHETTLAAARIPQPRAHTVLRMHLELVIDGVRVQLIRWVGCDRSFAEPAHVAGLNLWFDANTDIFEHLNETHGACRPGKRVRLALWEEGRRMCPVLLHPWFPLPDDGLRITDCYDADDCWLGPYFGADAHGGLDINHPVGTTLYTPFAVQRQGFYKHITRGDRNNSWFGECDWPDGSTWSVRSAHLIDLLVPEGAPLPAGLPYATAAGMYSGMYEHSHLVFKIRGPGASEDILLDPWLLVRQMLSDRRAMVAPRVNGYIGWTPPAP